MTLVAGVGDYWDGPWYLQCPAITLLSRAPLDPDCQHRHTKMGTGSSYIQGLDEPEMGCKKRESSRPESLSRENPEKSMDVKS